MSTTAVSETWPAKYVPAGNRNGGIKLNPEFVKLWESYLDEGMPYKGVAEVFGVHWTTVRNQYPGRGWTKPQIDAHGTFMKHHNEKMRKATFAAQV